MQMVGHATESIYRRYAIHHEAMLREGSAKLATWTNAQAAAVRAKATAQVRPIEKRRTGRKC